MSWAYSRFFVFIHAAGSCAGHTITVALRSAICSQELAEKNRSAQSEKALEKTKERNQRVVEIQKKKEQMDALEKENYDKATEERLEKAEERRAQLIEESKTKASADGNKVKLS